MDDSCHDSKFERESQDKIHCGQNVRHFHFEVIDSTNNWGKENSDAWEKGGVTVITADQQTGGRGRFNRRWESPAGVNIYATFCFTVQPNLINVGQLPLIMALSATQVMEELGFIPKIKWPNDLLLDGKKVCGILCETIQCGIERGVICGIGININMTQETADKIDQPATSLFLVSGKTYSVAEITQRLVECFSLNRQLFFKEGFHPFYNEYVSRSYFKAGDLLTLQDWQNIASGIFKGYDQEGALILRREDGQSQSFFSGEIVKYQGIDVT